ncbi:MAG: DNA polymerase IV [Bacteroidetes bacterium]|nr:MAG: DNA polymerase IV [Bacteroidota bacterium]
MAETIRKIIHVDMDAFYASVEQRDRPELRGRPVAVGGSRQRGVVAAASYEARAYGVHSAMPSVRAYRLCPTLVFVKPDFAKYKRISRQIRQIFLSYTELVEPLSLDEAYLDVSTNKQGLDKASLIARRIKAEIFQQTQLTASAGISCNKFLAKVASGLHKPDGLTLILPERAEAFIEKLPIEKFHGIGKVTAEKMRRMGIRNGKDLKTRSELELVRHFGKAGRHFYLIARGIDQRPVVPNQPAKSIGAENTFASDITDAEAMLAMLRPLVDTVARRLQKSGTLAKTITLKIKYHDFTLKTRSKTFPTPLYSSSDILHVIQWLLHQPALPEKPVRLLGVYASKLEKSKDRQVGQLTLDF